MTTVWAIVFVKNETCVCGLTFARARALSTTFSALVFWATERQSHQQACHVTDWCNTETRRDKHWHNNAQRRGRDHRTNTKNLPLHSRDKIETNKRLKCVNKQKWMQQGLRVSQSHSVFSPDHWNRCCKVSLPAPKKQLGDLFHRPEDKDTATCKSNSKRCRFLLTSIQRSCSSLKFRKVGKTEIYHVRKQGVCYRHASSTRGRRAAQIDRAPARGERPSAANGDTVAVVRKNLFTREESCVPSEAEDRLTVEAFPPIRRRHCACRVCRGWQDVRSVRRHSCQRCNICAMCSE